MDTPYSATTDLAKSGDNHRLCDICNGLAKDSGLRDNQPNLCYSVGCI
jgi:hypothetical protein